MKVKFKEAISCMEGSFAAGQVAHIEDNLAKAWLKSGQVELATASVPVTPDDTVSVKTPVTVKDVTPKAKANEAAPKKPKAPKAAKE